MAPPRWRASDRRGIEAILARPAVRWRAGRCSPLLAQPRPSRGRTYVTVPRRFALYLVVRDHLETFLATVRQERGKDMPHYVEEELRRY